MIYVFAKYDTEDGRYAICEPIDAPDLDSAKIKFKNNLLKEAQEYCNTSVGRIKYIKRRVREIERLLFLNVLEIAEAKGVDIEAELISQFEKDLEKEKTEAEFEQYKLLKAKFEK